MSQRLEHDRVSGQSGCDGDCDPSNQASGEQAMILTVGDDPFATAVRELISGAAGDAGAAMQVEHARTYLMAMGRLATLSPTAIIGQGASISGRLTLTAHALRELAPMSKLILIRPADDPDMAGRALEAGFDSCLPADLDAASLTRALTNGHTPANGDDSWLIENLPHLQVLTTGEPTRTMTPQREHASGCSDVDLLDRLLQSRRDIKDIALLMLAQHEGLAGVGWLDDVESPPQGHRSAAVKYDGASYGVIHAPDASEESLGEAAAWLGRWLALQRRLRLLAEMAFKDELTGVWNRRYFNRALESILTRAANDRFSVTLLVFDIDDFKLYNDRYGHAAGDDILREAARLMRSVVREQDVVARIGGDEFAVIFWDAEQPRHANSQHPMDVLAIAERFQRAICSHQFPKLLGEVKQTLTVSGGLAGFPWDGRSPEELLDKADQMAIQSKQQGKNAITLGPGAERACREGK